MKVLFLCRENSARSILAESLIRHFGKGEIDVYSAGTEPTEVDGRAFQAVERFGMSTAGLRSKHINEVSDIDFDYVITLCNKAKKECYAPVKGTNFLEWDFPDPKNRTETKPFERTLLELNERIQLFLRVREKS